MLVLYLNEPEPFRTELNWQTIYLDYPLKAIFTYAVWWLVFRKWKHWSVPSRILLTLALWPIWTKVWQQVYYWLADNFTGGFRLSGSPEWWDIYIPSLFYGIQFGIFYALEYATNLRQSERAKAESERLALAGELKALKAQLNPHFLYNAFNTISASVPPDQESTRELIAELSDMFRYQLKAARADLVPLGEELDFINDYLTLEKARFGERLRVQVLVPDELRKAVIPPMLLQPLVENAVLHGISPLLSGGVVTIAADTEDDRLLLRIADSGVGMDLKAANNGTGFGLGNTRRRLQLLYNRDLTISRPPEGGTLLEIEIPLSYVTKSSPDRRRSPSS